MKILGIDYGTKRVGIALSDSEGKFGQPHSVIANSKNTKDKVLEKILEIIKAEGVTEIVLGESKDFKGLDNAVMPEIREFKMSLEKASSLPVIFEPEFLTSHQAEYFQGKHELLDASAAALILQSYLDRKNNKKEVAPKVPPQIEKTYINIDDFAKVEIRAGKILKVEPVEKSSKLLRLEVDFGEEKPRQVVSGIAKYFPDSQSLVGRTVGFVANLEPRKIMGLESRAMILAVSNEKDAFSLLSIDASVPPGTKAK